MKLTPFVRNPHNYDVDKVSDETGLHCKDPSLTAQEFLEESDINYIADKFMRTGELKQVAQLPTNGDFQGIFDFQTAMNLIVDAKHEFMQLPAKIRSRFNNDPAQLIDFLEDPENDQEAIALGLKERRPDTTIESPAGPSKAPDAPPSAPEKPGPSKPPETPKGA